MAIEAQQLRIGNWVQSSPQEPRHIFGIIKQINTPEIIIEFSERGDLISLPEICYYGIPLSEEILIKCGFKKEEDCYNNEGVKIWADAGANFYHINSEMLTHLDSLHQLQNWYYFNVGEELEINNL